MKYFTRELYQGYQLLQGMTPKEDEKALNERKRLWDLAVQKYKAYIDTISDVLPKSAQQLLNYGFHDSLITSVVQNENDSLRLELDTCHVPWIEGDLYWLTFSQGIFLDGAEVIEETYWLYDELHLSEHAGFELHILCQSPNLQMSEFHLAADELQIKCKV